MALSPAFPRKPRCRFSASPHLSRWPGGAANVACNLAQLGARVTLIGACGDDATATDLAAELQHFPRITFIPVTVAGRPTSLKTRYRVHQASRFYALMMK